MVIILYTKVLYPNCRQIPHLDQPILSNSQETLSLFIQIHVNYGMLGIVKRGQRRTLHSLQLLEAGIANTNVVLESHNGYIDAIGGAIIANGLATMATVMLPYT